MGIIFKLVSVLGLGYLIWRSRNTYQGAIEEGDFPDTEPAMPIASDEKVGPKNPNDVEALARTIASEAGDGTVEEQTHIGWTVRNRCEAMGKSIYDVQYPWRAQKGSNPPFSSAREAKEVHRAIARKIVETAKDADPTKGSTSFFEPILQDRLVEYGKRYRNAFPKGSPKNPSMLVPIGTKGKTVDISRFYRYFKTAADIRASWGKDSDSYNVGRFEFFRRRQRGNA